MYRNRDKQVYNIYKKVMYDARYRPVSNQFRQSIIELQRISETFSEEQWQAIKAYQDAFSKLHNTMMTIALCKCQRYFRNNKMAK